MSEVNRKRGVFAPSKARSLGAVYHAAPAFEALEPRQLLSATFDPVTGTLTIDGTAENDVIVLAPGANSGDVIVKKAPDVENNTVFSGVNQIVVNGLAGHDKIKIKPNILDAATSTSINVRIDAGDGDDTITGGSGNDTILAGEGNDRIIDLLGNNQIDAGEGDNRIKVGNGNDTILAGAGHDSVVAKAGANVISLGEGNNTVKTGAGDDSIAVVDGDNRIKSLGGNNLIVTGNGHNKIQTGEGDDTIVTGNGDDTIDGSGGTNTMLPGGGDNHVRGDNSGLATPEVTMVVNDFEMELEEISGELLTDPGFPELDLPPLMV